MVSRQFRWSWRIISRTFLLSPCKLLSNFSAGPELCLVNYCLQILLLNCPWLKKHLVHCATHWLPYVRIHVNRHIQHSLCQWLGKTEQHDAKSEIKILIFDLLSCCSVWQKETTKKLPQLSLDNFLTASPAWALSKNNASADCSNKFVTFALILF